MTAAALIFYSIGMVSFGIKDILANVFYSLKDTKTYIRNCMISVAINIFLSLILIRFMGHVGIAFATNLFKVNEVDTIVKIIKRKLNIKLK